MVMEPDGGIFSLLLVFGYLNLLLLLLHFTPEFLHQLLLIIGNYQSVFTAIVHLR